jgi:hypothetical protein
VICGHAAVCTGGFIKTIIRVLRCVGHFNSKLLVDKVNSVYMLAWHATLAVPLHITPHIHCYNWHCSNACPRQPGMPCSTPWRGPMQFRLQLESFKQA